MAIEGENRLIVIKIFDRVIFINKNDDNYDVENIFKSNE
jgi:hypothetical protein